MKTPRKNDDAARQVVPDYAALQQKEFDAMDEATTRRADFRYWLEHRFLPEAFFKDPQQWIDLAASEKMFPIWGLLMKENGIDSPYSEADFAVHSMKTRKGTFYVDIQLPTPERTPLCHSIHMLYNPQDQGAHYITVEHALDVGRAFFCGWTKDGEHVNYGQCIVEKRASERYEQWVAVVEIEVLKKAGRYDELQ